MDEVRTAKEKLSFILKSRSVGGPADKGPAIRLIWSGPGAGEAGQVSPDGRSLSFIDAESGNLCLKEIETGKTAVVTKKEAWGKSFEFVVTIGAFLVARPGNKLAYGWFNKENFVELRTVNRDGSNVRVLYRQKNEMVFPGAWSPDGNSIGVGSAAGAERLFRTTAWASSPSRAAPSRSSKCPSC